jgi:hypothetical protein
MRRRRSAAMYPMPNQRIVKILALAALCLALTVAFTPTAAFVLTPTPTVTPTMTPTDQPTATGTPPPGGIEQQALSTINNLISQEVAKILALGALASVIAVIAGIFVYARLQSRQGTRDKGLADTMLAVIALNNRTLDNNNRTLDILNGLNSTFVALGEQWKHEAELNRQTIQAFTETIRASTTLEHERINARLQIGERQAAALDNNTSTLFAHTKAIGDAEHSLNAVENSITMLKRDTSDRLKETADAVTALGETVKGLPQALSGLFGERFEALRTELSALIERDRAPVVQVPGFSSRVQVQVPIGESS